jgi:acetyl esterase/lipase
MSSAEIFRGDNVVFASLLCALGVQAELRVWPGAFHRFQAFAPTAALSIIADTVREGWVKLALASD